MKFSSRAVYGLLAVLYLADRYGERAVPVSQIARDQGISASYLEQILNRLKQKGWVKSIRGSQGGYVLSSRPSDISVGQVFNGLGETPDADTETKALPKHSRQPAAIAADRFWHRLASGLTRALESVSLQELISEARKSPDGPPRTFTFNI